MLEMDVFSLSRGSSKRYLCWKKKHVSRERERRREWCGLYVYLVQRNLGDAAGSNKQQSEENNVVGERMCIHMPCMPSGIRARGFSRALREDYSARVTGRKGFVRTPDFLLNICYVFNFWKSQP